MRMLREIDFVELAAGHTGKEQKLETFRRWPWPTFTDNPFRPAFFALIDRFFPRCPRP
jgi:hypothetical protein